MVGELRSHKLWCGQNYRKNSSHLKYHPLGRSSVFPGGANGKEPAWQFRRCKRCRFDPCVRKMAWRRAWQPTRYSCLEDLLDRGARWTTSIGPQSRTRLKWLSAHTHTHTHTPLEVSLKELPWPSQRSMCHHQLETVLEPPMPGVSDSGTLA